MLCDSGSPVTVARPSRPGAESDQAPTVTSSVTPRASLASTRTGAAPAILGAARARSVRVVRERANRRADERMRTESLGSAPGKGKETPDAIHPGLHPGRGPATLVRPRLAYWPCRPSTSSQPVSPEPMRLAPLVLTSVLLLLPAIAVAEAAPVRTGSGGGGGGGGPPISPPPPPAPPPGAPAPPAAPRDCLAKRALPDSVLLRINGREDVTRRRFVRAVRLLGGDPDSLTPASRDRFLELVIEQRLLAARAVREPRPWDRSDSVEFLSERDSGDII